MIQICMCIILYLVVYKSQKNVGLIGEKKKTKKKSSLILLGNLKYHINKQVNVS